MSKHRIVFALLCLCTTFIFPRGIIKVEMEL